MNLILTKEETKELRNLLCDILWPKEPAKRNVAKDTSEVTITDPDSYILMEILTKLERDA